MPIDLKYLHGKRFCLVLIEDTAETDPTKVKLRPMVGRANVVDNGALRLEHPSGGFMIPSSCYPNILPSDGTDLLEDAEYYVFCKVSGMKL